MGDKVREMLERWETPEDIVQKSANKTSSMDTHLVSPEHARKENSYFH